MSDRLAAERACKDANPIIDGRKANVNLAYLGAKPRGNLQAGKSLFCCARVESYAKKRSVILLLLAAYCIVMPITRKFCPTRDALVGN